MKQMLARTTFHNITFRSSACWSSIPNGHTRSVTEHVYKISKMFDIVPACCFRNWYKDINI